MALLTPIRTGETALPIVVWVVRLSTRSLTAMKKDFLDWMYCQTLRLVSDASAIEAEMGALYMCHARLYVLADKFQSSSLKNDILDSLFKLYTCNKACPPTTFVRYIYENSTSGSALRKFVIARYCWHLYPGWWDSDDACDVLVKIPEFAADATRAFAQRTRQVPSPMTQGAAKMYEPVHVQESTPFGKVEQGAESGPAEKKQKP